MEDVLPELVEMGQHPRYMLVENVAGFEVSTPAHMPVCRMPYAVPRVRLELRSSVLIDFASLAARQTSSTRLRLLATLRALGYATLELLITPLQLGIPNSRLRYYLLAKPSPLKFAGVSGQEDRIWRHVPGHGPDWADPRTQSEEKIVEDVVVELREYLDEDTGANPPPHAIPDKVLEKWGRLFDIVLPSARRTCCFTRGEFDL